MKISINTKKCSECLGEVPKGAQKCQHCGSAVGLTKWLRVCGSCLGLFIAVLIIGGIYYHYNPSISPTNNQTLLPTEKITATALYAAYKRNEIEADGKYKGKVLEVSGSIKSIGKDIMGDMYVSLNTGDSIGSVQCMLEDSEKDKVIKLRTGQSVVVQGKNPAFSILSIILRNCVIKK